MGVNVRAFRVVHAAIAEPIEPNERKDAARKGGPIGGPSRAKLITAERRQRLQEMLAGRAGARNVLCHKATIEHA